MTVALDRARGSPPVSAAAFTAAAARDSLRTTMHVPGCVTPLTLERDAGGRLLTLCAGERRYVDARRPQELVFDEGFVRVATQELPGGLVRHVQLQAAGGERQWSERYGWDARGRLVEVDGVAVEHDARGRVVACVDRASGAAWHYGYTGEDLTVIQTPRVLRHVLRDRSGRPVGWRHAGNHGEGTLRYDESGQRLPTRSTPLAWEVDAAGRLLALRDDRGRIRRTFLWDGWLCLAAIDGEPGAPLAEVYSLDPGGTPVRLSTRHGMRRIPRDAFGEALLAAHAEGLPLPGLFGGAIDDDGLVHLPYRRLDPRLASFDRPDPLHGEANDPRRAGGWTGPLQIELPAAGPYTVCRHNPVSLADPTGAISDLWWLIPSALTWSLQNTIGSLLGMWLNLQFSPLGWIVSKIAGADPFDAEWISAHNHDAFGLRADGWMSRIQPVAWTYQFLVNEEKASFTALEDARLFSPAAAFRPTLYASLLHCAPASGSAFMLRGTRAAPNQTVVADWSRCGGTAESAIPGSLQPVFPAGGLHFDTVRRGVHQQRAEMVEVVPAATIATGIAGAYPALRVPGTALGIDVGADLLLSDAAGLPEVARVLDVDELPPSTVLQVEPALTQLAGGALRLQGLSAPAGTESLSPVAADARLLGVAGSSLDYVPAVSVVRLTRAGATVHVARVDGLQAQVALDAPAPATLGSDFQVRTAQASGNFTGRLGPTPNVYEVQSGTPPGPGGGLLIGSGAAALPALVVSAAGALLTVDRDLSPLGAAGTALPWQQLAPGVELGRHAGAPEASAVLTYAPVAAGTAPTAGLVWLQGTQAAVRRVTGRNHDALVMSHPRPDVQPDPYDTTRWRLAAIDIASVTAGTVPTVALNAALPAGVRALHLMPFPSPAVTAGGALLGGTALTLVDGAPPVINAVAGAISAGTRAGDVVVVTPASGVPAPALIRRLRLTVTLDRNLALGAGTLEAALIAPAAPAFTAARSGADTLAVTLPLAGTPPAFAAGDTVLVRFVDGTTQTRRYAVAAFDRGAASLTYAPDGANPAVPAAASQITVQREPVIAAQRIDGLVLQLQVGEFGGLRMDMPRFVAGELALVTFRDGGAPQSRHYVVEAVAGATLTCRDDAPLPPTATDITVDRLEVQDPENGGARFGIEGAIVAPNQLTFSVWDAADGRGLPRLAIVDGGSVHAVQVTAAAQPLVIELALAGSAAPLAGTVQLAQPSVPATPPGLRPRGIVTAEFVADNLTLKLPDALVPLLGGNVVAVVPYVENGRRVAGELHPGSVRMPDDHENVGLELTRRQALEDHELMHTVQSARLGPIMLVAFPLWALELANDLTAAGGPAFSPYLAGTLADGVLTPSNGAGFAPDGKVQVAQNRRVQTVTLGPAVGSGFRLADADRRALGSGGFANGAVQLRRPLGGTGNDVLEWISNIGQLLTIGGLMNVLSLAGWGGLAALIVQAVQGIRYLARSKILVTLGDDQRTIALAEGQSLEGLREGVLVALKSGDRILIRAVETMAGRSLTLGAAAPLAGQVELSVYEPGAALFGLRSYFPASVPDPDRPARLEVLAVGGRRLELAAHDRVEVRAANGSASRMLVTRAEGGIVELEHAVLLRDDQPNEFLIGKIAAEDPSGWLDAWMLNELQLGWMQYLHDPWGQILYRAQPAADDIAAQIFARSARYLFGTQSWMCCFLGFFWNDNAYRRANPHRSSMEQEASRRSGDTYSPLGSLHGDVAVVGDVARYWITATGGTRDGFPNTPDTPADLVNLGQQDAPGVHLMQAPTVTVPAGSAFALPGALYTADGRGGLPGISARGFVPANNVLERSCGIHVAFSRPAPAGATYRITAQNLAGLGDALDAQANGAATLFFDCGPSDVTVTVAGAPVAEGSASPVQVLPFQRLQFDVAPDGSRVYRVSVGGEGRTFDCRDLTATARGLLGVDDAEISRFHRFDGSNFDSGIGPIHLPADLHIAVRRFRLQVVDTLPLRAAADHLAAPAASVRPGGDAFLLVPSPLAPVPVAVTVAGALAVNAQVVPAAAPLSPATTSFLGDGGALQVRFPVGEPPEDTARVTVTIAVGNDAATAVPVRCEFDLVPAFTLTSAGGFSVAPGATLTLRSSDGTAVQVVSPPPGATFVATGADLAVTIDAGHAPGQFTVQAADRADAQRQARRVITIS